MQTRCLKKVSSQEERQYGKKNIFKQTLSALRARPKLKQETFLARRVLLLCKWDACKELLANISTKALKLYQFAKLADMMAVLKFADRLNVPKMNNKFFKFLTDAFGNFTTKLRLRNKAEEKHTVSFCRNGHAKLLVFPYFLPKRVEYTKQVNFQPHPWILILSRFAIPSEKQVLRISAPGNSQGLL